MVVNAGLNVLEGGKRDEHIRKYVPGINLNSLLVIEESNRKNGERKTKKQNWVRQTAYAATAVPPPSPSTPCAIHRVSLRRSQRRQNVPRRKIGLGKGMIMFLPAPPEWIRRRVEVPPFSTNNLTSLPHLPIPSPPPPPPKKNKNAAAAAAIAIYCTHASRCVAHSDVEGTGQQPRQQVEDFRQRLRSGEEGVGAAGRGPWGAEG